MISRIIAAIMSILTLFSASFSQVSSGCDLNSELAKGNYESPYIVRPLSEITINGVSVDEYRIFTPDSTKGTVFGNAAQTLSDEIYKACGKRLEITGKAEEKAFIINEELMNTSDFLLEVENGSVYITGSSLTGISRGITAFSNEILLNSQNTFDFTDGYKFSKVFSGYITYEAFGAVGDGKTDDFDAITKTHAYANATGLSVFANETATYYIGGANKTAYIMTDIDWSTSCFIIDDTAVENINAWVFQALPSYGAIDITGAVSSVKADADNIGTTIPVKSLVTFTDSNVKRYIRKGANRDSGNNQTDVIIVDENGNISPDTPLLWDFDSITTATAYPIDSKEITIRGGRFTTIANNGPSEYTYYARGIAISRSNTVIDGVYHDIENEGLSGAPYSAFIYLSFCADVTVKNCTFTGHKTYITIGSAGTPVQMGSYDIGAAYSVNSKFINCKQTNDITDIIYWGIAGTNYCKNLMYDGCALSRYDAHQGVLNATIKNSVLGHHGIKLIGSGTALIENTTVLAGSFIELRSDYGSTWNGDLIIRNCKFYPSIASVGIITALNTEDHDFGYTCYLPERIEIDGFYIHQSGINYLFSPVNPLHIFDSYEGKHPIIPTKEITVKDFSCLLFGDLSVCLNKAMFRQTQINGM